MRFACVLNVLGNLLLLLGAVLIAPLAMALATKGGSRYEPREVLGFVVAMVAAASVGLLLRKVCRPDLSGLSNREGAAIVTFSWIMFSAVGALPYVISGALGWTDAFFEVMSGFTTTGASILREVEVLPAGLQFWRHQTQWIGGMGIVVLSVAILPLLGVGGYRMFRAEAPGGSTFERNAPRIKETAIALWLLYLGLSIAETSLLWLEDMTLYDAVCHTFTTMSTGGFSTRTSSIGGWPSWEIQWTIVAFMVVAGGNFGIYQRLISRRQRGALRDPELRLYLVLFALATVACTALLYKPGTLAEAEQTLRAAAFTSSSIGTTTGYATADFDRWPNAARVLLLLLMFIGGSAGSTAGGMKVFRLAILAKAAVNELRSAITPRAVLVVRLGGKPVDRETVANTAAFFFMWMLVITVVTLAMTLLGLDLLSAFSAAAACLGNIGPGLGAVGPSANYAPVPVLGKWLLAGCMLVGRLELYTALVLLLPRTWSR